MCFCNIFYILVVERNKSTIQNFFNNHYFMKFLNESTIYNNSKEKIYFTRNFYFLLIF